MERFVEKMVPGMLPAAIREKTAARRFTVNSTGKSGACVLCFEDMVLKVAPQGAEAERERDMLTYLAGRMPVPEILCAEQAEGWSYLLTSRIEGDMLCARKYLERPDHLAELLAEGLRLLWNEDVLSCPYRQSVEDKLLLAQARVEANLCDVDDAEPETFGKGGYRSPEHLLQWLRDNRPDETYTLIHGDFCLPNLFALHGTISGMIDWGRGGVGDPYQDIALCYRSFRHNLSGRYGSRAYPHASPDLLFDTLGIEPDWDKIRYYNLLDELF